MELTQILCAKAGANVVSAENGKVAMTIVDNKHIDIVLTDLLMPACDGYILAEALRTTGFQGPIIGITAAIFVDKRDKFAKAGGDYLINKPIDMALLENTLRFLENRKSNY
jgi:DNA-binding response OmpR family regulator